VGTYGLGHDPYLHDAGGGLRARSERSRAWSDLDAIYLQRCRGSEAQALRTGFGALAAREYFRRSTAVVREEIPGALILGVRFAGDAPDVAIRACAEFCDVVSFNHYRPDERITEEMIHRYWHLSKKPLMITEFSWRARENLSGNPNERGAGAVVRTQAERASNYARFIDLIASFPMVVGWSWFEWADQSPQGRFDGENSNYGLVSIRHEPYRALIEAMAEANADAPDVHARSERGFPSGPVERRGVTYRPGQHPDRAPRLSLLVDPSEGPEAWHAADASIGIASVEDGLALTYETGHRYGVGISFFGPDASRLDVGAPHAYDLDGYEWIVVSGEVPAGLQIQAIVNETGAADPNSPAFEDRGGDDAESFISAPLRGTGDEYRFRIRDLVPQVYWGNQTGAREIEMRSVQSIALQFQGEPRRGQIRLHDVRLER